MVAAFGLIVFLTLERLGARVELLSIIGSRQDTLPDAGFLAGEYDKTVEVLRRPQ